MPYIPRDYAYSNAAFPMGVEVDFDSAQQMSLASQMGATWGRTKIAWSDLEPVNTTPGQFNWSVSDGPLARAAANGIQPLVSISGRGPNGNPAWAAPTTCGPINASALPEYTSFLQAVVSRYSQAPYNVKYWEISNEPDNTDESRAWLGGCFGNHPDAYANLLKVAYPAIKAVDPQARVVFGSLAYDWFTIHGGPFNQAFVEDVINPTKGNAAAYFDIMGLHYYPAYRSDWEPYGTDVIGKVTFIRDVMSRHGVNKPIVLTEIAQWNVSPNAGGSDEVQGRYIVQSFARTLAANVVFSIWFSMADWNDWGYGVLNADLSKKPSYSVFQALTRMMTGATYTGAFKVGGVQPSNIEGYTFAMPGNRQRHILWSMGTGLVTLPLPGEKVFVTDRGGRTTVRTDGDDGAWDGVINLPVTASPIYLDIPQ